MVRKWSYLNNSSLLQPLNTLNQVTLSYTFKVFRVTTRFKKFQRYETKFVRKQDSSRKRQTSWLTLTTLLSYWSLSYLKLKNFIRFYQTIGLYINQLTIPNKFVLYKKHMLLTNTLAYNTSSISLKLLKLFNVNFSTNNIFINNIAKNLKETNVSSITYTSEHYEIIPPSISTMNNVSLLFQTQLFYNTLQVILIFYKIFILLNLKYLKEY